MRKFYKIVEGTEVHDIARKVFHCKDDWKNKAFIEEFENKIGAECVTNLIYDTYALTLRRIPEGTESQFKKNRVRCQYGYAYQAKKNSALNKEYLALVKKYDLEYYDVMYITMMLGIGNFAAVHPFDDATVFVMESRNLSEDSFNKIKSLEMLEEIPAVEFYEMKAEQAHKADSV